MDRTVARLQPNAPLQQHLINIKLADLRCITKTSKLFTVVRTKDAIAKLDRLDFKPVIAHSFVIRSTDGRHLTRFRQAPRVNGANGTRTDFNQLEILANLALYLAFTCQYFWHTHVTATLKRPENAALIFHISLRF